MPPPVTVVAPRWPKVVPVKGIVALVLPVLVRERLPAPVFATVKVPPPPPTATATSEAPKVNVAAPAPVLSMTTLPAEVAVRPLIVSE